MTALDIISDNNDSENIDQNPMGDAHSLTDSVQISPINPKTLIVIDKSIQDYQSIISTISTSNVNIIYIESYEKGIEKLDQELLKYQGEISEIHILSHGKNGTIYLGNEALNKSNLSIYSEMISNWQMAFQDNADLYIYGCDVAETQEAQSFLIDLSITLNVDISASTDKTGSGKQFGDWDLEFAYGNIAESLIRDQIIQSDYQFLLAPPLNDAFADSVYLGSLHDTLTFQGDTTDAVANDGVGAVGAQDNTVWYKFTTLSDGVLSISEQFDSFDLRYQIFSSTNFNDNVGNISNILGASSGATSSIVINSAHTYWIVVDGFGVQTGAFTLSLDFDPTIQSNSNAHDAFSAAISLGTMSSFSDYNIPSSTVSKESNEPNHNGQITSLVGSLWHEWTAPINGVYIFDTNGSDSDTILALYQGTNIGNLIEVTSDDNGGSGQASQIGFSATAGEQFFLAIAQKNTGDINLNLSHIEQGAPLSSTGSIAISDSVSQIDDNPAGFLVSDLFGSQFLDPDGDSFSGIAITGKNGVSAQGKWQYSFDGTNWQNLSNISPTNAVILDSNDFIRFVPQSSFSGETSSTISVNFLDQTRTVITGIQRNITSIIGQNGISAFSVNLESPFIDAAFANGSDGGDDGIFFDDPLEDFGFITIATKLPLGRNFISVSGKSHADSHINFITVNYQYNAANSDLDIFETSEMLGEDQFFVKGPLGTFRMLYSFPDFNKYGSGEDLLEEDSDEKNNEALSSQDISGNSESLISPDTKNQHEKSEDFDSGDLQDHYNIWEGELDNIPEDNQEKGNTKIFQKEVYRLQNERRQLIKDLLYS